MANDAKTFMIEDARIIFRNFEGREGPYNAKGNRTFAVVLDQETADKLAADGWNVKSTTPREEGEEPLIYIQISVSFDNYPPRVVLITSVGRTHLNNDTVEVLDWTDIKNADLIVRGYDWNVNGKGGTKAYLKSLFVTVEEDELEIKYQINAGES